MGRTKKKAMELVFDLIKVNLDLDKTRITELELSYARWVYGNNDDENWLENCKIKNSIEINIETRVGLLEFDNEQYFFVTGFDCPEKLPVGISPFPLNPGLFVVVISELELPIKKEISDLYIEQNILSQSKSIIGYRGHDSSDLEKIFPQICVFKIELEYIGDDQNIETYIRQFLCLYLSLNKQFLTLPFSLDSLNEIYKFASINSDILHYDNIIQALLSSHFKFAFLDFYRCLELLYQIIYVDEIHQQLKLTASKLDLLECIEVSLNWKPIERNTIEKLFNQTGKVYYTSLSNAIREITGSNQNCSKWIYDLRCSIVHLKPTHKNIHLKSAQWNKIIEGLVRILIFWYNRYIRF